MERAHGGRDVERPVGEGQAHGVALDERDVRERQRLLASHGDHLGRGVDGDHLLRRAARLRAQSRPCRRRRPARARLRPARGTPADARETPRGVPPRARPCAPRSRAAGLRTVSACSASDKLQCLLSGGNYPGGALFGDLVEKAADLRARRQAELVAAQQRLVRDRSARDSASAGARSMAPDEARARRAPRARCERRKRWSERGDPSAGGVGGEHRPRVAQRAAARSAAARAPGPESRRDGSRGSRRAPRGRPRRAIRRARPAGRARRAGGSPSTERRSSSPRMRSPAGCETRAAWPRTSASVAGSQRNPSSSSRRTARSRRKRIGAEDAGGDGPDRARREDRRRPPNGSTSSAAADRPRERVDREVAGGEVFLDRPGERREVHRPPVGERRPPRAVTLGEGKRRAAHRARECARRSDRVPARDVDVDDGPPEQLVAERAADDPGVTAGDRVEDQPAATSSIVELPRASRRIRANPAHELVVDRAGDAGVLLGAQAVAEQRHRRSLRPSAREARPRTSPSRPCRRRGSARRRRGPRCRSDRAGSRPRSRPARARSRSAPSATKRRP